MSNASLRQSLLRGVPADKAATDISNISAEPDLDSAAALLELGGHPHILAREAVAVLEGAGCAAALALVAVGPAGPRVIEARGWTERDALAAARGDAAEIVPLGHYRDEPWQLVVDPKPELGHRCTFIAIRKLLGTAVTLDRYRREEKQRAALWPAEALGADADCIWASEQTSELLGIARRIASAPLSILLTGETGTGKEMLARTIHRVSDRAERVFLPFNCSAVPRDMLESQLFGYRKGAFTGADAAFPGVIRSAAGGTLFLDEIADVNLELQPKLLRFLETHEIHPLGEPQPVTVDVRVIAATNANLERLVAEGRFREDLFYRLNVVQLRLPPLRERREEIPALVDHYVRKHADEQKKGRLTLSDETLEYLLLFSWPGNVRQLANEVRRMVAMAEPGATLTPASLSPEIQASRRTIAAASPGDPEIRVRIDQPLPAAVEMLEQVMVRNALDRAHGRVEEAARLLGISRKGLFLKRRRWGFVHSSAAAAVHT
jgi:DNA-binding NtrC family response regulator